jgi:transposase
MRPQKPSLAIKELLDFPGFKLCGFYKEKDIWEKEVYVFGFDRIHKTGTCPKCKRERRKCEETYVRHIRHLNICEHKCILEMEFIKINCSCGYRGMEEISFLDKYQRITRLLAEVIFELCKRMCISDVAKTLNLDWKTIKRIDKEMLQETVRGLENANPTRIGIDEIAYRKGHNYLTVVRDLDLGSVIWVCEKRTRETLDKFFVELGEDKCKQIKLAVMDMWDPYIRSVHENTSANIVFDKFHLSKVINECLDEVRKKEFAKAGKQKRIDMKHKRFLILSRADHLDKEEKETLEALMKDNQPLYKAYLLKEQILDIFSTATWENAIGRIMKWINNVEESGIDAFNKAVKRIWNYFYGIINYFRYKVTNAGSEGFNTKINVIKRRAYGFRDIEYFRLKILQSCSVKR